MLRTISIKNFQAHREKDLAFHEGVNVITGTSDSGKTSILRSLLWLINNRPSGDAFKNWDAPLKEPVYVQLELEDGSCIVLERQNGKNTYAIFDPNGEEIKFSAIKTDVPKEVTDLLNFTDYNIQTQHQSYFLLQNTPGEIAKKLNDLVGLSIIDKLFSNIASEIRQASIRISVLTSDRDDAEKELSKYKKLDEIGIIIERLEKLHDEAAVTASSLNFIEEKLSSLVKIKTERENLIPLLEVEPKFLDISERIAEISVMDTRIRNINQTIGSLRRVQEELVTEKEWKDLEPYHNSLLNRLNDLALISDKIISLNKIVYMGKSLVNASDVEKSMIRELSSQYLNLIKESNICPTCGNRINAARLVAIERSFS